MTESEIVDVIHTSNFPDVSLFRTQRLHRLISLNGEKTVDIQELRQLERIRAALDQRERELKAAGEA